MWIMLKDIRDEVFTEVVTRLKSNRAQKGSVGWLDMSQVSEKEAGGK